MNYIFSGEAAEGIFIFGTFAILSIVWFGYFRNIYSSIIARSTAGIFVTYMVLFMWYRNSTGYVEERIVSDSYYALVAATHGIISLMAVILVCYVFVVAQKSFSEGKNYFTNHRIITYSLAILWPLALLSGLCF
ncbi:MAG: hypothetical protein K9M10_01490 [Candidatus Pacebacteria bacterium]|nr:hypothetical protein [Candidatus Paceibacterota bacterium]MCF7857137.1 hypothetical protein [Candidatus Paceibacterota bacterium]